MNRKKLRAVVAGIAAAGVAAAVAVAFWLRQTHQVSEQGPTDWHDFKTWPKEYRSKGRLMRLKLGRIGSDYVGELGELRSLDELRPDEGWLARYVYLDSKGREVFGGIECSWSRTGALTSKVWIEEGGLCAEDYYYPTGEPIRRTRVSGGVHTEECFDRRGNVLGSIAASGRAGSEPVYRWAGQVVAKQVYRERWEALLQAVFPRRSRPRL